MRPIDKTRAGTAANAKITVTLVKQMNIRPVVRPGSGDTNPFRSAELSEGLQRPRLPRHTGSGRNAKADH